MIHLFVRVDLRVFKMKREELISVIHDYMSYTGLTRGHFAVHGDAGYFLLNNIVEFTGVIQLCLASPFNKPLPKEFNGHTFVVTINQADWASVMEPEEMKFAVSTRHLIKRK